ncbi:MAG: hypothetical protein IJ144_06190 [Prevotella sp.]|jgi:hypothetical protein|nr:hypothetical protein [Prevotella sp.]
MNIKQLPLATVQFATIDGNRDVAPQRLMKAIKKVGRVLDPILVVKYQDIQDKDVVLYDMRTKQPLENPSNDYYVIIDGQHRSKCALQLFDEMQKEGSDIKFTDFIYANVYGKEDIQGQDIMSIIMDINSTPKCWSSKDYIKSAYIHNPKDETLIAVNLCTQLGYSISNASRYLCNNHKALNPLVLSRFISNEGELPESNPRKALEILRMLNDAGFSNNFLRKRYLAEQIVIKRNNERLDVFLTSLFHLDSATVKKIECLSPQDYDAHMIRDIVQKFEKNLSEEERAKCFVPDLSDKRFNENVEYFNRLAEELKAARKAKKTRKSNSQASKKGEKNVDDCTIYEVK